MSQKNFGDRKIKTPACALLHTILLQRPPQIESFKIWVRFWKVHFSVDKWEVLKILNFCNFQRYESFKTYRNEFSFEISTKVTFCFFLKIYKFRSSWKSLLVVSFQQVYVFRNFAFFVYYFFFIESEFLKSSCLLIKFFCFITLPTFHQVVEFHHFPNFSSGCDFSSLYKLFIRLWLFITLPTFHQLETLYQFAAFVKKKKKNTGNLSSVKHEVPQSCSLILRWPLFCTQKQNNGENDLKSIRRKQPEWKEEFKPNKYTSPPISTANIAKNKYSFYFGMLLIRAEV